MKKVLSFFMITTLCCIMLTACEFGSTTMDQGMDTDGKAGETNQTLQSETDKVIDDTKKAVKDVGKDMGNAAEDVVDGTERAIKDVTNPDSMNSKPN